ncbi:ester cyclase [Nodosilinea sp. PGN35]|uniref:ester cyclase n=1 Tax=Nodosilinea sp. PGN35 TaxID=3020489 RepID=UPI0023B332AC|nr:ester cyclase [Nodosilinea sp. TSF1-S3]MDF0370066.1 ester cyclase [Nodosilinea sp. TSF1-S3]
MFIQTFFPKRQQQTAQATAAAHKALARQFCTATWGQGNLAAVDRFTSPDFIIDYPILPAPLDRDGFKAWLSDVHTAFPDLQLTITDAIAEADKVALCWTVEGTNTGPIGLLNLAATGKSVHYTGILIYRIVNGRIVEERGEEDALGLFKQLGLLG